MSLASAEDVEVWLGRKLTTAETRGVEGLISLATVQLEGWLKRSLEITTDEDTAYLYAGADFVELPRTPVREVTAVSVDDEEWAADTWVTDRSGIRLLNAGTISSTGSTETTRAVDVTYSAGLGDPAASVAAGIIVQRVARLLNKQSGDALGLDSLGVEGESSSFQSEYFTTEELNLMNRWRRRVVSTTPGPPTPAQPTVEIWH